MSLSSPLPLHDAILTPAALLPLTGEGDGSHSRPEQGSCQQQCCNCHARCKLMYHIGRASMTNFLAPEEVPFQRQDSPPVRDLYSCIHMRACEISVQGSFAQPVVVHQRRYQRTSCPALTQLLHLRRSQRMRAGRCWGLCCRRSLLSLNIHVWIPTLKHRTQLPVQRPHSCL